MGPASRRARARQGSPGAPGHAAGPRGASTQPRVRARPRGHGPAQAPPPDLLTAVTPPMAARSWGRWLARACSWSPARPTLLGRAPRLGEGRRPPAICPWVLGSHRWATLRHGTTVPCFLGQQGSPVAGHGLRKSPGACGAPGAFGGRRPEQSCGAARPPCSGGTWVKPQHAVSSWRRPWEARRMQAGVLLASSMLWAVLVQQDTPGPPASPAPPSELVAAARSLCKPWSWILRGASGAGRLQSLARATGTGEAARPRAPARQSLPGGAGRVLGARHLALGSGGEGFRGVCLTRPWGSCGKLWGSRSWQDPSLTCFGSRAPDTRMEPLAVGCATVPGARGLPPAPGR